MSLNAYEIRLELLKMAKDLATEKYHCERSHAETIFHSELERANAQGGVGSLPNLNSPVFPTDEAITELANKLYNFVNTKQQ